MMDNAALKEDFVLMVREHQGIINSLCSLYYPHKEDQHDTRQDVILQLWKLPFESDLPINMGQILSIPFVLIGLLLVLRSIRQERISQL